MTLITHNPVNSNIVPVKRGRGRPKGAKNKPKTQSDTIKDGVAFSLPDDNSEKKRRGRPKGSKNKPKLIGTPITVEAVAPARPLDCVENLEPSVSTSEHPVIAAARWLVKEMPPMETLYYRKQSARTNTPLELCVALAIVSLFNTHDPEIRKQFKTN